jgi:hypothetical protein
MKQVASNKSSLSLNIQLQYTQTLQLFTKIIKTEQKVYTKVIKMPSSKVWVQRPSGLIKSGGKCKHFHQ